MPERFTVVTTMKNEAPYVLEWIAHHQVLGFDRFVVCTNDCEDTTAKLMDALEARGLIRHHRTAIRKGGIHRSALRQAARYPEVLEADWVYVCDADEFLNVHVGDGSVRALVEASGPDAEVISAPWRVFGSAAASKPVDERVTRLFRLAEAPPSERTEAGKFVKSLFRPDFDRIARLGLHQPAMKPEAEADARIVAPGGAPYVVAGERTETPPSFDVAQVNHYALRSLQGFLVKRARGRANHMDHVLGLDYWRRFDLNHVEDRSIGRYDEAVGARLAELRADEELNGLHRRGLRWHRRKAAAMLTDPEILRLARTLKRARRAGSEDREAAAAGA